MVLLIIISAVVLVVLVLVAAVRPERSALNEYEMKRRIEADDPDAKAVMRRELLLSDIESIQRAKVALLLVVFVTCSIAAFGWGWGMLIAFVVSLEYGFVARLQPVRRFAQKWYIKYEELILRKIEQHQRLITLFRSVEPASPLPSILHSRQELEHLVTHSGSLLSNQEKSRLLHSLTFDTKKVKDILTPRSMIASIKKDELLGPLVLDGLHKTGHSRFPVIDGDVDHVVGMLYVHDLMTLASKKSVRSSDAMEPRVFYIREDQQLSHALAAMLKTRHHLFVVINEFRETVGLLSLEDVLETLLGYKIMDEFDIHDDLRAVAARNPRANNRSEKAKDV